MSMNGPDLPRKENDDHRPPTAGSVAGRESQEEPRIHRSPAPGKPQEMSELRAQALLNELDRSLSSLRFRLAVTRWLYLPVMLLAVLVMVVGLALGMGTRGPVLGGIIAIAGSAAGFHLMAQKQGDELADVRRERDALLENFPQLSDGEPLGLEER